VRRNARFGTAGTRSAPLGKTHRPSLGTQQDGAVILKSAMPLILVVDDQPSNIHTLYGLLAEDCEVSMATGGAEALAFCAQQLPDLILLDVLMPEMSGYEVCDRLKADPRTRSVPIIFVTVQGSADDEAEGFAHGAVDYISKPFVDVVVKARVRTQLALKQASGSFRAPRSNSSSATSWRRSAAPLQASRRSCRRRWATR
jgi:CheY-like chemotaxis protein